MRSPNKISYLLCAIAVSALIHWLIIVSITSAEVSSFPVLPSTSIDVYLEERADEIAPVQTIETNPASAPASYSSLKNSKPIPSTSFPLDERYYSVQELDVIPAPITEIEPEYPKSGSVQGGERIVRLEIFIDRNGYVESVRLSDPKTPDMFEQAAIDAFVNQRFLPAEKNGLKVKSHLKLVVNFGQASDLDQP